ncbi:hypothetical protein MN116_004239 [Schistosoma mekongi]|uniref:C-CAP/cofactor C-like domain-containing protein n=1 Tax=Schistosoma mekongi TaxID=38744 RepID=A0AAE1ZGT0_SCHME|nr:hypothetical protein MN116_004239 [Schistosoma mekongi]
MSSENINYSSDVNKSRQTVLDRLNERHEQSHAIDSQRERMLNNEHFASYDNGKSHKNFLQHFIQYKAVVVKDLEDVTEKIHENNLPINERTKILDDILVRLEHMQRWLNETSMYLNSFDSEQARLELKSVNDLFQEKRTQLLPVKKFGFSHKKATKKQENVSKSDSQRESETFEPSPVVVSSKNDSTMYDPRFSLINITGPKHFVIPSANCLSSSPDSLISQTVYLVDLTDCSIEVCGVFGSLIGRRLKNCQIYSHPIAGSVWLDECVHCDLVFACRQLRVHQTSNCRLSLHMASRPIIEHCTNLKVAPYQLVYDSLNEDLLTAGLSTKDDDNNLWHEVDDFSCPNKRLTKTSPNWCIMPENDWSSLCPSRKN